MHVCNNGIKIILSMLLYYMYVCICNIYIMYYRGSSDVVVQIEIGSNWFRPIGSDRISTTLLVGELSI